MTAFNPNTNGIVNSIALDPADCGTAWIGGKFSTVGGQPATNIAAVDTATGALKTGFKHTPPARSTRCSTPTAELLAGGYFSTINGASPGQAGQPQPDHRRAGQLPDPRA